MEIANAEIGELVCGVSFLVGVAGNFGRSFGVVMIGRDFVVGMSFAQIGHGRRCSEGCCSPDPDVL